MYPELAADSNVSRETNQIKQLIEEYKIVAESEFFEKVPSHKYEFQYRKHHRNFKFLVSMEIEIFLQKNYKLECEDPWGLICRPPHGNKDKFETLLKGMNLDIPYFMNCLYTVFNKLHDKKNTIRLVGPVDACKTLCIELILDRFICKRFITNHGSLSDFYLSQLQNCSVYHLEELFVTPATADDFKSVLGGKSLDVNTKHCIKRQRLSRTPGFITTNYNQMGRGMIIPLDEHALNMRCFSFILSNAYKPVDKIIPADCAAFFYEYSRNKNLHFVP